MEHFDITALDLPVEEKANLHRQKQAEYIEEILALAKRAGFKRQIDFRFAAAEFLSVLYGKESTLELWLYGQGTYGLEVLLNALREGQIKPDPQVVTAADIQF